MAEGLGPDPKEIGEGFAIGSDGTIYRGPNAEEDRQAAESAQENSTTASDETPVDAEDAAPTYDSKEAETDAVARRKSIMDKLRANNPDIQK